MSTLAVRSEYRGYQCRLSRMGRFGAWYGRAARDGQPTSEILTDLFSGKNAKDRAWVDLILQIDKATDREDDEPR